MKSKSLFRRLLAYFGVPVIFCVLGYLALYGALQPVWETGKAYATFFVSDHMPEFSSTLTKTYEPEAVPKAIENKTYYNGVFYDTFVLEADGSLTPQSKQLPAEESMVAEFRERLVKTLASDYPEAAEIAGIEAVDPSDDFLPAKTSENTEPSIPKGAKAGDIIYSEPYRLIDESIFPHAYDHYGQVKCERIGLDAPVYWYDSDEILLAGAGQSLASKPPGFGRLILMAGHNNTVFECFINVAVGDVIHFNTNYDIYDYVVTSVEVVDEKKLEKDLTDKMLIEDEELVMYTCYPFYMTPYRKTNRLTVTAKRISGLNIKWRHVDE